MKDHYILQIDTATPVCSVSLGLNGKSILLKEEEGLNIHAERLTIFIQDILREGKITLTDLSAIAISNGPGSYTGLRIGVSTVKGLCYGAGLPVICIDSLTALAYGFSGSEIGSKIAAIDRLVPMIDARRMEVYQAVFDAKLERIHATHAQIIDSGSYQEFASKEGQVPNIFLFGSGADKLDEVFAQDPTVQVIKGFRSSSAFLENLAYQALLRGDFEDLAYFEPTYLKEFVPTTPKKIL